MQGRNILVTGAFGFIGSYLVNELAKKNNVTALGINDNGIFTGKDVKSIVLDMRTPAFSALLKKEKYDIIFHLGGNVDVVKSIEDPMSDFEANVLTTINALEALRMCAKDTKFVYASSIGVYGENASRISELTLPQPISPYGASKLCADHYCRIYAQIYGLRVLIIRYGTVFGPGLYRQFIYDMLQKIEANPKRIDILGTGDQLRDLSLVTNHIKGTIFLAERSAFDGSVYNIGYGTPFKLKTVARYLQEFMCSTAKLCPTGVLRKGDVSNFRYDISKAVALGYRPEISFIEGLVLTVDWFQEQWVQQHKLKSVSVVICTYNEKENIRSTVDRIEPWLQKISQQYNIIFVDDSSPDGTTDVIKKMACENNHVSLLLRKRKEGIGAALKEGIAAATGEVIITMDADLSQDPKEFIKFAYHLQHGAKMVIGSRYMRSSRIEGQPWLKRNASKYGNIIIRFALRTHTKDLTHSYRAFYKESFIAVRDKVISNEHPNCFIEFTKAVLSRGHRIVEVPVIFKERKTGISKLGLFKAGNVFLRMIFKMSFKNT